MRDHQDLIDRIEAVFERVGVVLDEQRQILRRYANMLAPIVTFPALPEDIQQRRLRSYSTDISQEATADEIRRVSLRAREFREALSGLHNPSIKALFVDRGISPKWRYDETLSELRRIEAEAAAAEKNIRSMSAWPYQRQRARNQGPRVVAGVVVNAYELVSGGRADLPARAGGCPGLEKICAEIFEILGIKASPKAAIAAALKQREEPSGSSKSAQRRKMQ